LYIIKYKEHLENPNHFVLLHERIGNENRALSVPIKSNDTVTVASGSIIRKEAKETLPLKINSEKLLKLPERKSITKAKNGIKIGIKNVVYKDDKVYMQLEIKNRSGINFDVDFLNVYRVSGNKKRKASYQKLSLNPIYKHELPETVRHGETTRFIYVFDKFTLGDNEKVLIKLQEENGSRLIEMKRRL